MEENHEKAAVTIHEENDEEFGWAYYDDPVNVLDPTIWIADTGASVHSTPNLNLTNNWQNPVDKTVVIMGNEEKEEVVKVGCIKGIAKYKDATNQGKMSLSEVMYLPNGKYNLLSVTKVMRNGWKLEGDNKSMSLSKGKMKLTFNTKIPTARGVLNAVKIVPDEEVNALVKEPDGKTKMSIMEAHELLGHILSKSTIEVAKNLGWNLLDDGNKCENCAIGKGIRKMCVNKAITLLLIKLVKDCFLMLLWSMKIQVLGPMKNPHQKGTGGF